MKLIALQIIPDKDQCTVLVSIDYAPSEFQGEFKPCYVTLAYGRDGGYHVTNIPPFIDPQVLEKATVYGQHIIDTALTALQPLFNRSEP